MKNIAAFALALLTLVGILGSPSDAEIILNDFQVNVEPPGHPPQDSPYSTANPQTQTIYTTWLSKKDGTNWDVALQTFNYDLQITGEVRYLNLREGTYSCKQPRLAVSFQGVGSAWIEARQPNRIIFRALDSNGNPISSPIRVEDNFGNVPRDSLSLAALNDGYLMVWYDERDSSKIWAQKVDFYGNLIGNNFPIQPDSSGSILGLEAQNHPDGRVLVSWVTDHQYSRGQWLDADGNFIGSVFNMAQPWSEPLLRNSLVRFEPGGSGLLYQYDLAFFHGYIYLTCLDSQGCQTSAPISAGIWYWLDEMGWISEVANSFSDVLYLPGNQYISVCLYNYNEFTLFSNYETHYNRLYSSVAETTVVPWGVTAQHDLCQLNPTSFLYTYNPGYVALRKYEVSTLDSSQSIVWTYEPGFGAGQDNSDLIVHGDGSFRIIYNNHIGSAPNVYTRHFSSEGIPSAPDTLVSMALDHSMATTDIGRIVNTNDDRALVIWPFDSTILGTTFDGNTWSQVINDFTCNPAPNYNLPSLDVNSSNHVMLIWANKFTSELGWLSQEYFQAFSQIFSPLYSSTVFVGTRPILGEAPKAWDVSLRDDGHFLLAWVDQMYSDIGYCIVIQSGVNYHELVGQPLAISTSSMVEYHYVASAPVVERNGDGYIVAWVWGVDETPEYDHVYIRQIDGDGNPISEMQVVDDSTARPTPLQPGAYLCDLAVAPDDRFAVVWQDQRSDVGDLYCRQFNSDGTYFGQAYRVNSDSGSALQKEPAVAFGPEDRLYFTWTDFRNPSGQGDIYCKVLEWNDALGIKEEITSQVYQFVLNSPAPNPFNPNTVLRYQLAKAGLVNLVVYDVSGRIVTTLVDDWQAAGNHLVEFNAASLSSGIYICRLQAGDFSAVQKLALLK